MGDKNPIRTLEDYYIPSHEGYRNTIELPEREQCDSLDLDVANRERTRMRLFQFSLRDKATNWLERLPAGKSLSEAWTRFKDLLQKVPHHDIDRCLQIQKFYDHVSFHLKCEIDRAAGGKLRDKNADESWEIIKNLALYDHEGWNDSKEFVKPVKGNNTVLHDNIVLHDNNVIEQVAVRSGMDSKMAELLSFKHNVLDFGTFDEANEVDDKLAKSVKENITKNEEEEQTRVSSSHAVGY
ncbi:hypothetical protein Tco_0016016 [Tanacetum coccineum]